MFPGLPWALKCISGVQSSPVRVQLVIAVATQFLLLIMMNHFGNLAKGGGARRGCT